MECTHVGQAVKVSSQLIQKIRKEKSTQWTCSTCRSTKSPWICLRCGVINCGSYACDEFVINDTKSGDIQRVREIMLERENRKRHLQDSSSPERHKKTSKVDQENLGRVKFLPGLRNLGNTCFMNASFSCYFKDLPAFQLRTDNSCGKQPYFTRSRKTDEGCLESSPKVQQQDAHEFMHYLLDRVHTELLLSPKFYGTSETIITGIFGGLLHSEVKCLLCGTESKKYDPFLDLSLEIPAEFQCRKSKIKEAPLCQLQDCLNHFISLEELADSELYICPNCKKRQRSTKKFWLKRLPNRFKFQAFHRSKVDTYVQFPVRGLDMSPYCMKDQEESPKAFLFDLAAVVVHHGSGTVTRSDEGHVSGSKGYIFFYTRRHPNMAILDKIRK
ncbi:Ubiquitin carboxyl-terminal hydrolase 3 [Acropora cervicornis]|uniref:ubiquitinyl hydrolase 1 n=1 Tax=Acropora cervicornis TaxID=6130 RepID=A0AAD9PTA7_ACRCE|nr:Ubiquitin carboxyl-terminal hydrolase 3 [Acropora cervicornis]